MSRRIICALSFAALVASSAAALCPPAGQSKPNDRFECPGTFETVWMTLVTCSSAAFPDGLISLLPSSTEVFESTMPNRVAWMIEDPKPRRRWTIQAKEVSDDVFPGRKVITRPDLGKRAAFYSTPPTATGTYRYEVLVEEMNDLAGWIFCARLDPEIRVKDDPLFDDEDGDDEDEEDEEDDDGDEDDEEGEGEGGEPDGARASRAG